VVHSSPNIKHLEGCSLILKHNEGREGVGNNIMPRHMSYIIKVLHRGGWGSKIFQNYIIKFIDGPLLD
jgi:hypothetical protein